MRHETLPEVDFLTTVSIGLVASVLVSGCWAVYASVCDAIRLRRWERSLVKVARDGDAEAAPLLEKGGGRSGTSEEPGKESGRGGWKDDGIKAAREVYWMCVFTVALTPFVAAFLFFMPSQRRWLKFSICIYKMIFTLLFATFTERDWLLRRIAIAEESKTDEQGGEEWRNEVARVEKAIRRAKLVMFLWYLCAFVAWRAAMKSGCER